MSTESDIRKLLKIRADLEYRVEQLQIEIEHLKLAMAEIDKTIVKQGFHQPAAYQIMKPSDVKIEEQIPSENKNPESSIEGSSIQAKDGTILGKVQINDDAIIFTPKEGLSFTTSTPPFKSFLIDRVLLNMKTTDEARAATGEITPEQVLTFSIEDEDETIKVLTIRNFGGERRLREIQSSLRWSFDKMYDKIRRG
jgi:hypothetical protein